MFCCSSTSAPGKAWEHLTQSRMTFGGHKVELGGKDPHSNNILDFIIDCSVARQEPRHSQDHEYSAWRVRNSFSSSLHNVFVAGHCSLYVHLVSMSQVFHCSLMIPCIMLNANQRAKMGEAWEQLPLNSYTSIPSSSSYNNLTGQDWHRGFRRK